MNWPSARSSRASGAAQDGEARAGELRRAWRSPSCPSASPSSKCCFGAKSKIARLAACFSTTLAVSSAPSGTSGSRMFGSASSSPRISRLELGRLALQPSRHPPRSAHRLGFQRRGIRAAAPSLRRSGVKARCAGACFSCNCGRARRAASSSCARTSRRPRRQPAPRHRGIERRRVGPDRADVVHGQTSTGFGSTMRRRDDGDLVKRDQRHREAGLGDDVGRRQDRRR